MPLKFWAVGLPFLAVVASFLASTLFERHEEKAIAELAHSLSEDAMPSIERLSAARTALREIDALADDYVKQTGAARTQVERDIRAARGRVDENVDAYLALPVFEGEHAYWAAIRTNLARVDASILALRQAVESNDQGRMDAASTEVAAACSLGANAMGDDIEFNAGLGREATATIERLHDRATEVAFVLDALSAVLASLALLLAVRVVRGHLRIVRERNALVQDKANELELFAGRVAHDIRNPLNAVSLSFAALKKQVTDPKASTVIARGERSAGRALSLLDGLLSFAQAGARPSDEASVDVADVVNGVIEDVTPLADQASIELRSDVEAECFAACEPSILSVVISNLTRNAIRYIGDGAERHILVRAFHREEAIRIEVEDTGVGVAPDQRERIFQPFVRGATAASAYKGGVGLGLATVHKICTAHGGRVWVEERAAGERGSRFCVELPRATPVLSAATSRVVSRGHVPVVAHT